MRGIRGSHASNKEEQANSIFNKYSPTNATKENPILAQVKRTSNFEERLARAKQ